MIKKYWDYSLRLVPALQTRIKDGEVNQIGFWNASTEMGTLTLAIHSI